MKKWYLVLLCMIAASAVMSGCAAGNASGMDATASPAVSESPAVASTIAPMASVAPTAQPSSSAAPASQESDMTPAEAGRLAERIGEAVERISEVDDAEVAIHKGRVLVAVEFDDQYKMGLDDRMKQMIMEAVKGVDDSLTDVQITDDDTLYGQIKGLAERIGQATGVDELADDFGDLWDRIVGR